MQLKGRNNVLSTTGNINDEPPHQAWATVSSNAFCHYLMNNSEDESSISCGTQYSPSPETQIDHRTPSPPLSPPIQRQCLGTRSDPVLDELTSDSLVQVIELGSSSESDSRAQSS